MRDAWTGGPRRRATSGEGGIRTHEAREGGRFSPQGKRRRGGRVRGPGPAQTGALRRGAAGRAERASGEKCFGRREGAGRLGLAVAVHGPNRGGEAGAGTGLAREGGPRRAPQRNPRTRRPRRESRGSR